jgi:hypothetical protein
VPKSTPSRLLGARMNEANDTSGADPALGALRHGAADAAVNIRLTYADEALGLPVDAARGPLPVALLELTRWRQVINRSNTAMSGLYVEAAVAAGLPRWKGVDTDDFLDTRAGVCGFGRTGSNSTGRVVSGPAARKTCTRTGVRPRPDSATARFHFSDRSSACGSQPERGKPNSQRRNGAAICSSRPPQDSSRARSSNAGRIRHDPADPEIGPR